MLLSGHQAQVQASHRRTSKTHSGYCTKSDMVEGTLRAKRFSESRETSHPPARAALTSVSPLQRVLRLSDLVRIEGCLGLTVFALKPEVTLRTEVGGRSKLGKNTTQSRTNRSPSLRNSLDVRAAI